MAKAAISEKRWVTAFGKKSDAREHRVRFELHSISR
jgi:hypothetical protein